MKAVNCITVYNAVEGSSTFGGSVVKVVSTTIQMKATGQLFPVKLFNLLRYKLVILFGSVDKFQSVTIQISERLQSITFQLG